MKTHPSSVFPKHRNRSRAVFFAAAAAGATLLSLNASAQQTPWYLTGEIGQSRYDSRGATGDIDRNGNAYNVGAGFRFSPNVAIEAGYTDFGKWREDITEGKAKTAYGALVLTAPVSDRFSVFGRLGYGSTDRSFSRPDVTVVQNGTIITSVGLSSSDRKSEAIYGVGAAYQFTPVLAGTLSWQRLDDTKVDSFLAGLRVMF